MARGQAQSTKRRNTKKSLEDALVSNKLSETFLQDKVEEYMSFYDDLIFINELLTGIKEGQNCTLKMYTEATAEKRRISSEMRNILRFLGLKPTDTSLPSDGDKDEEL